MMAPWIYDVLEFTWGGADASLFQKVLRLSLVGCTVFCVAQLLALWGTRWGERRPTSKAFALSLLFHLCLGIGCTVVADAHRKATQFAAADQPVYQVREIRLEAAPRPAQTSTNQQHAWQQPPAPHAAEIERTAPLSESPTDEPAPQKKRVEVVAASREVPKTPESAQFSITDTAPEALPEQDLPTPRSPVTVNTPELPMDAPAPQARADIEFAQRSPARRSPVSSESPRQSPLIPERTPREPQVAANRQIALSRDLLGTPTTSTTDSAVESPRNLAAAEASGRRFKGADGPQEMSEASPPAANPNQRLSGLLAGLVTDAETGQPLAGAKILIDQADLPDLSAATQSNGAYRLGVTELPDNVAVTVVRPGYLPESRNLRASDVRGKSSRLNFALRPVTESVIPVEEAPEVHHLGNDVFAGAINSQFQRRAEGTVVTARFPITAEQLQGQHSAATVTMLVKGMQCRPILRVNGVVLPQANTVSPADGTFGTFAVRFNPALLLAGSNQISIQTTESDGDLDDFEFVNVQVRLVR